MLGSFDCVRFGADWEIREIRERMHVLGIRVGELAEYLYACPDRWIERAQRTTSLTGNAAHDPTRLRYVAAYRDFHASVRRCPPDERRARLRYAFPPVADAGGGDGGVGSTAGDAMRPFPLPGLSAAQRAAFFPDVAAVRGVVAGDV